MCIYLLWGCMWGGGTHTEVLPWKSEENLQDLVCPSTVWIQGLNLGPQAWWSVLLTFEVRHQARKTFYFFFFLRQHPTYPRLSLNLLHSSGTTVWNSPVPCGDYRCVPATPRASNWRGGGEGGRALCILGNKVPFLSRILEVHWKNASLELEMSISCILYFM